MSEIPTPFERVEADSPMRCQMIMHKGNQCNNKRMENSPYCAICDQGVTKKRNNTEALELYKVAMYQERVKQFRDNPRQKSLADEIGLLRMLVEEKLNSCLTKNDLSMKTQAIADLIMKIQMTVVSAAKLDQQLNNTLTRAQIDVFGANIIQIISAHVPEDKLEIVADEIQKSIAGL